MLWMPTSKVTRVRREGFSKMRAMCLPRRTDVKREGRALMSAVRCRRSRVSAGDHSAPVRRSLAIDTGIVTEAFIRYSPRVLECQTDAPAEYSGEEKPRRTRVPGTAEKVARPETGANKAGAKAAAAE